MEYLKHASALEDLLTDEDLARLFRRKLKTVRKDRLFGRGPKFIKIGRSVRYLPKDVAAFLEERSDGSPENTR